MKLVETEAKSAGDVSLQVLSQPGASRRTDAPCVVLVGNPNAGKTTVFNELTGLRAKTANFPGTTVECRQGRAELGGRPVMLVDLPGLYTMAGATAEEQIARDAIIGAVPSLPEPATVVVVVDATNLERNLFLVSQVLELRRPTVVALNMMDLARRKGVKVDVDALTRELGCPVVAISARQRTGMEQLRQVMELSLSHHDHRHDVPSALTSACSCSGCPFKARYDWAEHVAQRSLTAPAIAHGSKTERIDRIVAHPVVGIFAFFAVMLGMFYLIFSIASVPMDLIDSGFGAAQNFVSHLLPDGMAKSFLVDGVIGGVGGVLVFLPQICILFFFLSLLEDTGYLARAAFVMDRLMRRVGLPGKAFVPMLSAHACAIPAIMATRVIEDRRDRLVTILTIPLLTCSARIPVYTMVTALLFADHPLMAAVVFTGAYSLGILAALTVAFALKRTVLPGETRPLVLELPTYKLPCIRTALYTTWDRAMVFVTRAGTVILAISVGLWILSTFPQIEPPTHVIELRQHAEQVAATDAAAAAELAADADRLEAQHALSNSFAGRLGHLIEPVMKPLGFDWQISIGVISSFAAREVIVSTLAIVYGVGADVADENPTSLLDTMRSATRRDGTPVFTTATGLSLLVFYVLAMQCLPTQAVTRRETGSWKWAAFQLGYMTVLAYSAALITYQVATVFTA